MKLPEAVYVHVPFCEQICHYCDFNKVFLKGQPIDGYIDATIQEMKNTVELFPPHEIKTIYLGGGTPTALSADQLDKLLSGVNNYFKPVHGGEYTVEVNPGSATKERLAVLKNRGVNRLSIGVQAFQNDLLKKIGRTHQEKDIHKTIKAAREFGIKNLSIDLMFGLPGQTVDMFKETLQKAIQLEIPHFSAYSLKIEEKTVFYQLQRKGKLILPSEDAEVEMYEMLIDILTANGYNHYEISNFCKPGFESTHNLTYWNNEEYYGIGAGAHGYVNGKREANAGPIKKYMTLVKTNGRSVNESHEVTETERIEEQMFMGLRKIEGISIKCFIERFHRNPLDVFKEQLEDLMHKELIEVTGERIKLTKKGLVIANEVFEQFLL